MQSVTRWILTFHSIPGIQCSSRIPLFQRPWTPGRLSNVRLFPRYVVIRVHVGQHDFPQRAILSRPRQLRSGKYCCLFPTFFRIYCLKFDGFWILFFCVNFFRFTSKISNHVVVVANQNSKFFPVGFYNPIIFSSWHFYLFQCFRSVEAFSNKLKRHSVSNVLLNFHCSTKLF